MKPNLPLYSRIFQVQYKLLYIFLETVILLCLKALPKGNKTRIYGSFIFPRRGTSWKSIQMFSERMRQHLRMASAEVTWANVHCFFYTHHCTQTPWGLLVIFLTWRLTLLFSSTKFSLCENTSDSTCSGKHFLCIANFHPEIKSKLSEGKVRWATHMHY